MYGQLGVRLVGENYRTWKKLEKAMEGKDVVFYQGYLLTRRRITRNGKNSW